MEDKTPIAVAKAESPEDALEVVGGTELNEKAFDAIVKFSERTEEIGKALDRVRGFFFKRAFSGDFVSHNGKTVNISGPGAERILSALGLMGVSWSLTDWEKHKDEGSDNNGKWFTHWYSAEGQIGGMRPGRLEGRAGSRDKLFGYKDGKFKDLSDVKEPDIQMAARRCVYKELVRIGLGMRNIPIDEAVKMGLDANKIAKIVFGAEGEKQVKATPTGTPVMIIKVDPFKGTCKNGAKKGQTYIKWYITDDKEAKYYTWDEKVANLATKLMGEKKKVLIDSTADNYGNQVKELSPATESNGNVPTEENQEQAEV